MHSLKEEMTCVEQKSKSRTLKMDFFFKINIFKKFWSLLFFQAVTEICRAIFRFSYLFFSYSKISQVVSVFQKLSVGKKKSNRLKLLIYKKSH